MAEDKLILHVGDLSFDADDLTFGEQREVRRLVRGDLWSEELMGPFDWNEVPNDEVIAATIAVWMKRTDPTYTLEDAMKLKPADVYRQNGDGPPTKPSGRASARKKTSAPAGDPS